MVGLGRFVVVLRELLVQLIYFILKGLVGRAR